MNHKQREWLANKLADVSNLAVAVLVFGWVMAKPRPSIGIPIMALMIWIVCHGLGYLLLRGVEDK